MGDTGAHWAGIYGGGGAPAAEDTAVMAAAATAAGTVSSPTSGGSGGSPTRPGGGVGQPGVVGGRIGKPARRRSRASRRAPVTLLNTDTSNFRAMVQQFTGIPSGPYGPSAGAAGPVISFGGAGGDYGSGAAALVRPSPTSAVMSFDHLTASQHRPTSLQGQLFRPQHHQQQQYGGDVGYGGMHGGHMSSFLHGFESSAEDRLLLQSMQAAQMMPTRPASTNNSNGYNFG